MKEFYGNYLGVVVTGGDKDPEGRGRTQIFIPNIMPALYDLWNEKGEDISFEVIGEGLEGALNPEILSKLQNVLPWAECAVPITGASPSYKPSVLGQATEAIRNVGSAIVDAGKAAVDALGLGGVPPGDTAGDVALSNAASKYSYASGKCGTAVGEILEGVYGYSESDIRAGSPDGRRDGKNYGDIMRSLKWEEKKISRPEDAPPGAVIYYDAVPGNSSGHTEIVGVDANGKKAYYFGIGAVSTPAGGSGSAGKRNIKGFTGTCFVPPPNVRAEALRKLGVPTKNPSDDNQASTTNMTPDPGTAGKNEQELTASYDGQLAATQSAFGEQSMSLGGGGSAGPSGFGSLDGADSSRSSFSSGGGGLPSGVTKNELTMAMRMIAAESGVGAGGSPKNEVFNLGRQSTNAFAYGGNFSVTGDTTSFFKGSRKDSVGLAYIKQNPQFANLVDTGYVQCNNYNVKQYGLKNSGSLKDQAYALAQHISNQTAKDPQLKSYIESGNYDALTNYKNGKSIPAYNLKKEHELSGVRAYPAFMNELQSKYGGDPEAALAAYNEKYPSAPSVQEMMGPDYQIPDVPSDMASAPTIKNPTSHPGVAGPNTNNQALGMFGYASEGQAVWVFFREGNPLFPVYFAASYGQKEWASMFGHASPGVGAGVTVKNPQADGKFPSAPGAAPTGAIPGTEASQWNSYGGGIRSAASTEESPLGTEFLFQLYGKNGSHFTFLKDHTEFYSPYDHVSRVMADHQDITEANKEVRVRGDYNTYAEQDLIISVGNWSQEAIDASDEIQKYINEAMKIKTEAGNS